MHVNVHVLVLEMFKRGARKRTPFSFSAVLGRYLGRTKFTVTGTHTITGTPSLVPGR